MRKAPAKAAPVAAPTVADEDHSPDPGLVTVENCVRGTTLHLADGSSIEFGETAKVGAEERAFLIERGQVR